MLTGVWPARTIRYTFSDPAVGQQMSRYTLLQADVTANNESDRALLKRYALFDPQAVILHDAQGRELAQSRAIGEMASSPFLALLDSGLAPPALKKSN